MSGPSAPPSIDEVGFPEAEVVFPELSPSVDSVSDTLSSPIPESASDTSSMSAFKESSVPEPFPGDTMVSSAVPVCSMSLMTLPKFWLAGRGPSVEPPFSPG